MSNSKFSGQGTQNNKPENKNPPAPKPVGKSPENQEKIVSASAAHCSAAVDVPLIRPPNPNCQPTFSQISRKSTQTTRIPKVAAHRKIMVRCGRVETAWPPDARAAKWPPDFPAFAGRSGAPPDWRDAGGRIPDGAAWLGTVAIAPAWLMAMALAARWTCGRQSGTIAARVWEHALLPCSGPVLDAGGLH